jgi:hypothetical protein
MALLILSVIVGVVAASTADEIEKVQKLNSYTSTVELFSLPLLECRKWS